MVLDHFQWEIIRGQKAESRIQGEVRKKSGMTRVKASVGLRRVIALWTKSSLVDSMPTISATCELEQAKALGARQTGSVVAMSLVRSCIRALGIRSLRQF